MKFKEGDKVVLKGIVKAKHEWMKSVDVETEAGMIVIAEKYLEMEE